MSPEEEAVVEWVSAAAEQEVVASGPMGGARYFPLYKAPWHARLRHWVGHWLTRLLHWLGMLDPYDYYMS